MTNTARAVEPTPGQHDRGDVSRGARPGDVRIRIPRKRAPARWAPAELLKRLLRAA